MTKDELTEKLKRRIKFFNNRAIDAATEMGVGSLSPIEVTEKYNYYGGRHLGYLEGRLEGFLLACDMLEAYGFEGLFEEVL